MIKPWQMQQLKVVIMQKELLIERLRARLCGENHQWVETASEFEYSTSPGGFVTEVDIVNRKVCTVCEKIEIKKEI